MLIRHQNGAAICIAGWKKTIALRSVEPQDPVFFTEPGSVLMNPATRAFNAVSYEQLVGLLALSFAAFTISYIGFMRQEVRGT